MAEVHYAQVTTFNAQVRSRSTPPAPPAPCACRGPPRLKLPTTPLPRRMLEQPRATFTLTPGARTLWRSLHAPRVRRAAAPRAPPPPRLDPPAALASPGPLPTLADVSCRVARARAFPLWGPLAPWPPSDALHLCVCVCTLPPLCARRSRSCWRRRRPPPRSTAARPAPPPPSWRPPSARWRRPRCGEGGGEES